jgi:hypothetical protein
MTKIAKSDLDLISPIMSSGPDSDLYGYIDRETGEVLIGSDLAPLDICPDEENGDDAAFTEFERRFLPIPHVGSNDSYQDMVDFIETVQDKHLQDLLGVAIQGRGAFGRFKDVLRRPDYEAERQRWFDFAANREQCRVEAWLAREGIELETA